MPIARSRSHTASVTQSLIATAANHPPPVIPTSRPFSRNRPYDATVFTGRLLTKFPDVQFDGVEAGLERLMHGLQSYTIDVAVAPVGQLEEGIASRSVWSEKVYVAVPDDHELATRAQIYWQDLRREIFVVPSGGLGPIFENLIASRLTEQGRRPNIIVQDTSLESVLSIVAAKRYISIATGASQGVAWSDLRFQEIHDPTGPARLEYALYWRANNDNPALKRFFKLIEERYPG